MADIKRQLDFASDAAERDFKDLPPEIIRAFGYGLRQVQQDNPPANIAVLTGFGGAGVLELKEDDENNGTYRAVYTTKIEGWVYVLHAFQKKSHKGKSTDKDDIDKVKKRLREAQERHKLLGRDKKGDK